MALVRIGIFGFLTALLSFFTWGYWQQNVVTALRVNTEFVEGSCVVLETHVVFHESGSERSTSGRRALGYSCHANIRYTVAGKEYETGTFDGTDVYYSHREEAAEAIAPFVKGMTYPCWYDPEDPYRVVIIRRESYVGNFFGFVTAAVLASASGIGLAVSIWSGLRNLIFGAPKVEPRPRMPSCPKCHAELRTAEAQQCFECGHAWHR